mmetsp:Transcript_24460/g.54367  ORF Transcript_24460/g.54367 Transcript_24460/m.54367 type:complete len:255 (-) Transcript_24460:4736-5500(-)
MAGRRIPANSVPPGLPARRPVPFLRHHVQLPRQLRDQRPARLRTRRPRRDGEHPRPAHHRDLGRRRVHPVLRDLHGHKRRIRQRDGQSVAYLVQVQVVHTLQRCDLLDPPYHGHPLSPGVHAPHSVPVLVRTDLRGETGGGQQHHPCIRLQLCDPHGPQRPPDGPHSGLRQTDGGPRCLPFNRRQQQFRHAAAEQYRHDEWLRRSPESPQLTLHGPGGGSEVHLELQAEFPSGLHRVRLLLLHHQPVPSAGAVL